MAIFAGIAAFAIVVLIGRASFLRGIIPFTAQSPTSTLTQESRPASTLEPTVIADTPTLAPQRFYTEEFDGSNSAWMLFIKSGKESDFDRKTNNGKLVVHIPLQQKDEPWAYLINEAFTYTDAKVEVVAANTGNSENGVSLVCRYSDSGWYEFRISNGGSSLIHTGKATNTYTTICKGNELSLEINGTPEITTPTKYDFPEGNIGIGFSSPKKLPVDVEFESIKISEP